MTDRYEGNEERKDIHEKNIEYLNRCWAAADYCSVRLGWKTIECTYNGEMRSIDDIQAEIIWNLRDNLI